MKSSMFFCGAVAAAAAAVVACGSNDGSGAGAAPRANGTLGEWMTLAPMPVARANHCAVAAGGWLVVLGGNHRPAGAKDFVTVADVHAARLNGDGTIGPWQLAGTTPSPVSSCTATADGNTIVLVDGIYDDASAGGKVRTTTIGDDGKIAPWADAGSLPDGVRVLYSAATVSGGEVRAAYAKLPQEGDAVAMARASLGGGGAVSAWSSTAWLEGFRGHPENVFAGSFVYALGGYGGPKNAVLADGAGARLDASGAPGPSFDVAALPKPTAFGAAVAVDDWVFVVGGKDGVMTGAGRADVFAAKMGDYGALATWTDATPLPQGRTSQAVVAYGDFLYVLGGGYDAAGLDTVFAARVRFP